MRARSTLAILACVALFAGCGGREEATAAACIEGADTYLLALEAAPDEVLLAGETPISACLTENQGGGDLATVGGAMVEAATQLNAEALEDPGGEASAELGYLLGAATRGAEETEGIHADLLRRLAVAARYAPGKQPVPPALRRAYMSGYAAGHLSG